MLLISCLEVEDPAASVFGAEWRNWAGFVEQGVLLLSMYVFA